ncbi:LON peptidase substrate-binding domain-containing protein [Candidatus Pelagibacter sp.]|nr:LON peptidase substrate-binding domain-containing protein [Candidatus Pelagibacter sp.]
MKNKKELPNRIPIFPLSNFIIFPSMTVPLNIFEPRYIEMIDDAMKGSRVIGMVQPKKSDDTNKPELYNIGCVGKITNFNETEDGRYLIALKGLSRFKIINEINNEKKYRECEVSFNEFTSDVITNSDKIKFTDLKLIFKDLKTLFEKKGYIINWNELQKQNLDHTINTLSMASPFSLEEKQILLETQNLNLRKTKLEEILKTYIVDDFNNTTIQ